MTIPQIITLVITYLASVGINNLILMPLITMLLSFIGLSAATGIGFVISIVVCFTALWYMFDILAFWIGSLVDIVIDGYQRNFA